MAVPYRAASTMDARPSTRSARVSMESDVSSNDEYALAALGISDARHTYTPAEQTPGGDHVPPAGGPVAPPRPSSTTKPRYDSFALRHDGDMGTATSRQIAAGSTSAPVPIDRYSIVSSDVSPRPESVYQGPSAPSHPYQMYPQQARLARTASTATTSTAQVSEMSYTGSSGMTMVHPNRGDPQYIGSGIDTSQLGLVMPSAPVVGFPGRNNNYQRRLGPDGEDIADLIGPDGHTEQLPPYTKYADEAMTRKAPNVQVVVPGAGGMGLATRNPEFASREDLSSPQSQQSASPSIMSGGQLNASGSEVTEKPKMKKWKQVARRKVCDIIPIWVFVVIAICFILFAILLGTVLALLKPPHRPKKQTPHNYNNQSSPPQAYITTTEITMTTVDASPFQTLPTGIPPLATGSFILPVTVPAVAPASCIADASKNQVWGCQIQPFLEYQISITSVPGRDELSNNQINLDFNNKQATNFLPYGAQPPVLDRSKILRLVNDSQNPERGPAWFFQSIYDKVVILPESALTPTAVSRRHTSRERRGSVQSLDGFSARKLTQPGEKPWFCYWNCTLVEAFIYVNQSSSWKTPSYPSSLPPSSSSVPTGPNPVSAAPAAPTQPRSQGSYQNMGHSFYPNLVKLEERRVPMGDKHVDPYCVQQTTNSDGTYQPVLDANGNPTTIAVKELDSLVKPSMQGRDYGPGPALRERDDTTCGCLWLI